MISAASCSSLCLISGNCQKADVPQTVCQLCSLWVYVQSLPVCWAKIALSPRRAWPRSPSSKILVPFGFTKMRNCRPHFWTSGKTWSLTVWGQHACKIFSFRAERTGKLQAMGVEGLCRYPPSLPMRRSPHMPNAEFLRGTCGPTRSYRVHEVHALACGCVVPQSIFCRIVPQPRPRCPTYPHINISPLCSRTSLTLPATSNHVTRRSTCRHSPRRPGCCCFVRTSVSADVCMIREGSWRAEALLAKALLHLSLLHCHGCHQAKYAMLAGSEHVSNKNMPK